MAEKLKLVLKNKQDRIGLTKMLNEKIKSYSQGIKNPKVQGKSHQKQKRI